LLTLGDEHYMGTAYVCLYEYGSLHKAIQKHLIQAMPFEKSLLKCQLKFWCNEIT